MKLEALREYREKYLAVLWLRGQGLTLEQIGEIEGVSRERVRQILARSNRAAQSRYQFTPCVSYKEHPL